MKSSTRKPSSKSRKKSAAIHFDPTGKNMTSKAGLITVVKFLDKLGFNNIFKNTVKHERGDNAVYRLEDGVEYRKNKRPFSPAVAVSIS